MSALLIALGLTGPASAQTWVPDDVMAIILGAAALNLNQQAPIDYGDGITLEHVTHNSRALAYRFRLSYLVTPDMYDSFDWRMKEAMLPEFCRLSRPLLSQGVSFFFEFADARGNKFSWSMTEPDCARR